MTERVKVKRQKKFNESLGKGGKIDNNGIYTAPAQEGVYEIKVSVLAKPEIYAHAFVIVSQRKNEE